MQKKLKQLSVSFCRLRLRMSLFYLTAPTAVGGFKMWRIISGYRVPVPWITGTDSFLIREVNKKLF